MTEKAGTRGVEAAKPPVAEVRLTWEQLVRLDLERGRCSQCRDQGGAFCSAAGFAPGL
jgi:hypothetical protein